MLFHTHLLLGITFFLFTKNSFSGGNEIIFLILVLFGSILPDIDESKSKLNHWFGLGKIAAFFSRHRGLFHSLIFTLFLFFLISFFTRDYYAYAVIIGYFSHLVGDAFTPMGIQIFYPFSNFKLKGPIKVGHFGETIIMVLLALVIVKIILF
ncbi:MAG: metal-dependent hydrolase [Nanoarchaeota archaeon]|nr:metal-dependent hydrolase [Nanoarchaeota archaeon]